MLENTIAALDNGRYCLTLPSGCAALALVLERFKAGDHIICASETYGGTRVTLLDYVGLHDIAIDFVDVTDLNSVRKALRPATKVS